MAFMNIMALRRAVMALKSLSEYLPLHSVSETSICVKRTLRPRKIGSKPGPFALNCSSSGC